MKYAEFNASDWPIITVSFTGSLADESNFTEYLSCLDDLYISKERFVIIFDARNARFPGLKYQRLQANWIKENQAKIKRFCFSTVYVISNLVIRNALRLIFLIQEQPTPYQIVSNLEEAVEYAQLEIKKFK